MINIANIGSHYMNLTSKNLNNAINQAIEESEKTDRTTLLFIDEIDSMGYNRNSRLMPDEVKQVTSLLQGLDKAAKSKVMIISATNKYDLLDPALTRRFDHKILVDIPDEEATQSLIVHTLKPLKKAQKLLSNPNEIKEISKLFKGYSNKSVCSITKQAALNALDRNRADIEKQDFELAIEKGNIFACNNLGLIYEKKGNFEKAFKLYEKASNKNESWASNKLGEFYRTGKFVKKDMKKAFFYYNKSNEDAMFEISAWAKYNLAVYFYKNGNPEASVERDLDKAISLLKEASEVLDKAREELKKLL
jgi:TPR repeat protein